ncbi:DNA replication protein [Pantoea sp. 1.19]|uniref:DNA replication protein n=1 Tax=Pantoea sp. 1.19 TaxID=1925589 RepID=UPI000948CEA1|nr:DNA replication protein [Pantoea sp. 1.19]
MSNVLAFKRKQAETPEVTGKGFALLHRKIMELPFYKDPEAAHLWIHLILKAKYSPENVMTDLGEKLVRRGELLSGRNALAFETGLSPDRVQYLLRKFKKLDMVSWVSNSKFSIIRITKYDDYQLNSVPADHQQITSTKPGTATPDRDAVPANYQQITTDNELLTNNSISKDIECATSASKHAVQKQRISCEEVWQCLKEELPEARGWRVMDEDRRNLIKRFWGKANKIARQFDNGEPLTMEGFRTYLQYISANCRWMLEDRPDNRTGKTWRRMKFDSFLSEKLYRDVREGDKDDR